MVGSLFEFQYVVQVLYCLKSVPPTAALKGVEASPFTFSPYCAGLPGSSQPAEPLSPDDTKTLIPCAAACSHSE